MRNTFLNNHAENEVGIAVPDSRPLFVFLKRFIQTLWCGNKLRKRDWAQVEKIDYRRRQK